MKRFLAAVLSLSLLGCTLPAHALDGVTVEYGAGTHAVHLWRIGLQFDQEPTEWMDRHSRWSWYWDLALGGWHSDTGTVHDVSATPVFRYAKRSRGPYLEGAIGFHVLSDSHISTDLGFSTRFQFGDHLGVGYDEGAWGWQLRLQHISNGGMRNPNPGINFLILRLQYKLP